MLGITIFFYLFLSTPRDLWLPQEQFDWMYCEQEMWSREHLFRSVEMNIRFLYSGPQYVQFNTWLTKLKDLDRLITKPNKAIEEARQKARRELLMRWISNSRRE